MTKDIIITIRGLQAGPNTDGEPIEMITTGEYFYKNDIDFGGMKYKVE